ncbi:MAG: aminodeoxychorismate synthase component I [Gammaproteobacteria bacterium]|nr:aminodeoxychorismate synthase component I [Gammaproteobacteria bacterium]
MSTAAASGYLSQPLAVAANLRVLQQHRPDRYPYLLQSVARGTPHSRYDILFAFPGERLTLHADGSLTGGLAPTETDFLQALDNCWRCAQLPLQSACAPPPFRGGWFVFLGYELAGQVETVLRLPHAGLPVAWATRVPAAIIHDHATGITTLVAETGRLDLLEVLATDAHAVVAERVWPGELLISPLKEDHPEHYLGSVARAHNYIHDGDIFQANLSRLWQAQLHPQAPTAEIYRRLCQTNPAPFAGLVLQNDYAIISSSPERLVRVNAGKVETRPIAGTRPRSGDAHRDAALVKELIENPKERAEHVMLLDLERNDLGRIAVTGSVRVDELMVVESYAHVHHIVSNVRADLRAGVTPGEVLRAVFPGGTITGCPKVRCMEIIAELEQAPRGIYTGSMGYLNRDGDMDFNILIRTLVRNRGHLEFRTGAGIVMDSIPQRELEETRAKARGLARALGVAL